MLDPSPSLPTIIPVSGAPTELCSFIYFSTERQSRKELKRWFIREPPTSSLWPYKIVNPHCDSCQYLSWGVMYYLLTLSPRLWLTPRSRNHKPAESSCSPVDRDIELALSGLFTKQEGSHFARGTATCLWTSCQRYFRNRSPTKT